MRTLLFAVSAALLASVPAAAQVHRCPDGQGGTIYQQTPCPDGEEMRIEQRRTTRDRKLQQQQQQQQEWTERCESLLETNPNNTNALRSCAQLNPPRWRRVWCLSIDIEPGSKQAWIGMTKDQVECSYGRPTDINRTVTASGEREQWVYRCGAGCAEYIYLRNGEVTSFQD